MNYILEVISETDKAKIILDAENDADPLIYKMLTSRGGHFNNNPNLRWAIDRSLDSYIFYGPIFGDREYFQYTFYFERKFVRIRLKTPSGSVVHFEGGDLSIIRIENKVKEAIRHALLTYGHLGRPNNGGAPLISASFQQEE